MAEEFFQNNFFDTEYLKADLKGRSVRGGAVTMAAQGVKFFLQIGSMVVLARLLTPEDFGLIAMVTAVTGFVMMFKDMGLSMATVQRAEINHAQISTLFWINVVLSLAIMLLTATLAPVIAWFYSEPRLTWITLALAGAFIFSGFTVQHQALLRRQMNFGRLAVIEITSMLVGVITAIVSALYGAGYWALVLMQLSTAIVGAIAVWMVCGWRPGLPVRHSGVREMLTFGGYLVGHNVLNYIFRNLDKVLIGRVSGNFILGLYSKASHLLLFPISQFSAPIAAVVIPALSKLQNVQSEYKQFYLKAVYFIAFLTMPVTLFLFVHSGEIIHFLLGDQWLPANNFFKILCVAAIYRPITNTTGWLFVSSGRTNKMFRWRISTIWVSVSFYFIGAYFMGALGVAFGHTISVLMLTIPLIWYSQRGTNIGTFNVFKATFRPLFSAIFASICSVLIFTGSCNLILSCLVMLTAYMIFNCIFAFSFAPLMDFRHIVKYCFPKAE